MSQYTLLLVDDEEEVIQMIMQKLPWAELGFSVIGHANNGVKALEMMEEYQPDVVMSDIHMPYMDGLELCSHIKQDYPSTLCYCSPDLTNLNTQERRYIGRLMNMF